MASRRRRANRGGPHEPVPGSAADLTPAADPESVARAIALRQLAAAPRTRAQLAAAMSRRGVPEPVVETVLDRFEEVDLVDDEEFARQWVQTRRLGRGLARRALSHELRARGVDDAITRETLGQIRDCDEFAVACELIRRRLPAMSGDDPVRRSRRLAGMLARKGYGAGVTMRALRAVLDELGPEQDVGPDLDLDFDPDLDDAAGDEAGDTGSDG